MTEVLVGTKKGLFVLNGEVGSGFEVTARAFPGQACSRRRRSASGEKPSTARPVRWRKRPRKRRASGMMSARRSRRGGTWIRITSIR